MKRVLMVAYHFPPLAGSSGIQRTLRFVQHLPGFGWEPAVLTVGDLAYEKTSDDLSAEVPAGVLVRRAIAFDTARHLAIGGRYLGAMARPDRWVSWRFDGVRTGLQMIRHWRPDVIWSTYPIATAHLIASLLHARSGIPWVADFRDPMAQDGYPADPLTWKSFDTLESNTLRTAQASVFTTPGAARIYRERYPDVADRISVIENGYDEETFQKAEGLDAATPLNPGCITLLHSGIVYPSERDPTQLFQALAALRASDAVLAARLRIRFRAAVHDQLLRDLAQRHGVQDLVQVTPPIPYREALNEMRRADALLVLQASNCNDQIPAKIYEYLRARRPMLCLSDPIGDTVGVMRSAGLQAHAPLDSAGEIAALIARHVHSHDSGRTVLADEVAVQRASRRARSQGLATLLSSLVR